MQENSQIPQEFIKAFDDDIFGTIDDLVLTRKLGKGASAEFN